MDDSFISPSKVLQLPSATSFANRKSKLVPRLKADKLEVGDALRGAHLECPVCRKNLENLSEIRRAVHVNTCVDASVNKKAVEKATKEAETMFICSFCNETVAKGPYLIAHANKCAKVFDMPVQTMITALEAQSQVAEKVRKNGFKKSVPVTAEMIQKAKKRSLEEEDNANSSGKEKMSPPQKTAKSSTGRTFMPGILKSTVFETKEKHNCRCEGLHVIQDRFCGQFKAKKVQQKDDDIKEILEDNVFMKKLGKMDRLSRLADDFRKALFSQKGDIKLCTKNGLSISAHSFVLKARTSMEIQQNSNEVSLVEFSNEIIEYYLLYVYSGLIEWSINELEDIKKLALLYGPSDLHLMMMQSDNICAPVASQIIISSPIHEERDFSSPTPMEEILSSSSPIERIISPSSSIEIISAPSSPVKRIISTTHFTMTDEIQEDGQSSISNDSFFNGDFNFSPRPSASSLQRLPAAPLTPIERNSSTSHLTLSGKTRKIAARLGSGVKVLKVYDVTPMPTYENYTDDELKQALVAFGIRPLGRKKAIEELKKIYNEVHPLVPDLNSATPKRNVSPIRFDLEQSLSQTSNGSQDQSGDALNQSLEENPEESMHFGADADESIGPSTGNSPTKLPKLIKDVETGAKFMLEWLRLPENDELYSNLLAFRTVNLDELMAMISKSTHSVRKITKKVLPDVLDKLYIAFYVPDKKWKRRPGYKSG